MSEIDAHPVANLGLVAHAYQPETLSMEALNQSGTFPVFGANGIIGRHDNFNHEQPQVVIACRGNTCGAVNRTLPKSWINGNAMVINPHAEKLRKDFLFYVLEIADYSLVITGSAQPQIIRDSLYRLRVPLPPLETQQRIADYLDRETAEIDAAVADLDKYVELLETRRQLHIDQTFSALLENWPRAPLGLFFSILNGDRGVNYPKAEEIAQAGIPFINAGDVTERRVSLSQAKFVSEEKYESMGGAKLRQGDILFCLRGSLGKHGLVDFDGGSVASSLCVLRPKNANTYRSRFLNLYLDSKFIESEVRFSENGSAQPNLSADSLSRFKVPAVSTEQQENVSTSLEEMHKEIDSLIIESTRLRDLILKRRSILITEVVTGRKQV